MIKKKKPNLLKLNVQISTRIYPVNLEKELAIDTSSLSALNSNLASQPSRYAWYSVLHAMAKNLVATCERDFERTYAMLDKELRMQHMKKDEKITDKGIDAAIKRSKKYGIACKALIEAKYNANLLQAAVKAFEQRKDDLQTISSNIRSEMARGFKPLDQK